MMKIEIVRDSDAATLRISGVIAEDQLAAILTEVRLHHPRLMFDLAEATLVGRAVVQYLAQREREGIELLNCPRYIREWIVRELGQ
jgi:hypothetical protein